MAFEWDAAKETANLEKHGVDFSTVPEAFDDPRRLVVADAAHSASEPLITASAMTGGES